MMEKEKSETLIKQIAELYDHQASKDVVFRFKDTDDILRAHKTILGARSEVFMAMFYGPLKETDVSFDNL